MPKPKTITTDFTLVALNDISNKKQGLFEKIKVVNKFINKENYLSFVFLLKKIFFGFKRIEGYRKDLKEDKNNSFPQLMEKFM